jgi:hypothetical protein
MSLQAECSIARKILIVTTDICKAQSLLESLMPPSLRAPSHH